VLLSSRTEFALIFFTVLILHSTFRFFKQVALALKTECALKLVTVLNLLFTIFQKFALALKFFTVLNMFLPFRIFKQLCTCPEKQSLP